MRRLLAWLTCAAGAAWIVRRFRRSAPNVIDPAEDLRRKLEESRADEPPTAATADSAEPGEVDAPSLDERRRAVHDRGRAAIDEMRGEAADQD
jgi:hypothetical protein